MKIFQLYERTSVVITTKLSFSEWANVFGDAKMNAWGVFAPAKPSFDGH